MYICIIIYAYMCMYKVYICVYMMYMYVVYVCMMNACVCMFICVSSGACVEVRSWPLMLIFTFHLYLSLVCWPESFEDSPVSASHLSIGIHICATVPGFTRVLGIRIQVLTSAEPSALPISHLPSPASVILGYSVNRSTQIHPLSFRSCNYECLKVAYYAQHCVWALFIGTGVGRMVSAWLPPVSK